MLANMLLPGVWLAEIPDTVQKGAHALSSTDSWCSLVNGMSRCFCSQVAASIGRTMAVGVLDKSG